MSNDNKEIFEQMKTIYTPFNTFIQDNDDESWSNNLQVNSKNNLQMETGNLSNKNLQIIQSNLKQMSQYMNNKLKQNKVPAYKIDTIQKYDEDIDQLLLNNKLEQLIIDANGIIDDDELNKSIGDGMTPIEKRDKTLHYNFKYESDNTNVTIKFVYNDILSELQLEFIDYTSVHFSNQKTLLDKYQNKVQLFKNEIEMEESKKNIKKINKLFEETIKMVENNEDEIKKQLVEKKTVILICNKMMKNIINELSKKHPRAKLVLIDSNKNASTKNKFQEIKNDEILGKILTLKKMNDNKYEIIEDSLDNMGEDKLDDIDYNKMLILDYRPTDTELNKLNIVAQEKKVSDIDNVSTIGGKYRNKSKRKTKKNKKRKTRKHKRKNHKKHSRKRRKNVTKK